ncbi:DUF6483 family protein [Fodinibius sp. Rm-B-1B1-1]|uniref:DUF6483 family protein n=1 Tax=Fodinibius alkaliphilus TaxID=3140241 RepID=UPI00315AB200
MSIFQQDFLMRQIQYLTQLLQQVIFKKNQQKPKEAIQDIHNAFERLTKDRPDAFHELSLPDTISIFCRDGNFTSELAAAAADLLFEEGKMKQKESYSQSQKCYAQALLLYRRILKENKATVPLDISTKIDHLTQKLNSDYLHQVNNALKK